jgi:hypothetical protein
MKRAKDQILNSFIFNFDTPAKVLHEQETYEFYGYPKDFLEQYRAGVEKVTSADVLRVANQYLHKEELKVLVVGNASGFDKQLAALGPVTPIDITIPSPEAKAEVGREVGSSEAEAETMPVAPLPGAMAAGSVRGPMAGGNPEGKAAVARLAEAMGGAAKVASVKTLHQLMTMTQENAEMKIDQSTVYPDKQAQRVIFPSGLVWQVVSPEVAFIKAAKVEDLTPSQRDAVAAQLKRDFLNVLQHAGDPKYTFSAHGKEKLGDAEATVVDVNADGLAVRWWIGPDGFLLQEEHIEAGARGPQTYTTKYSKWQDFDGLKYPAKQDMFSNGTEQASEVVKDMKVNPDIDPKMFDRPKQ